MALRQNTHKQHGVYEKTHLHNQSFVPQLWHSCATSVRFDSLSFFKLLLQSQHCLIEIIHPNNIIQRNNSPHCYIPKLFKFLSFMKHKRPFSPELQHGDWGFWNESMQNYPKVAFNKSSLCDPYDIYSKSSEAIYRVWGTDRNINICCIVSLDT